MGIKHTIKKNSCYFLTMTVVSWIDVFTYKNHKDIIIDSLRFCIKNKGLNVHCYCVMTNHLHMIVSANEPFELKNTIRDFKRHTAKKIIEQMKGKSERERDRMLKVFSKAGENSIRHKNDKFWQTGSHAIELFNDYFIWRKINYIHNNPVKAGFVEKAEEWEYSSASNYYELKSILPEVRCIPRMG